MGIDSLLRPRNWFSQRKIIVAYLQKLMIMVRSYVVFFTAKSEKKLYMRGMMPCDLIELLRLHVIYGLAFCWRCEGSSECASADSYSECCN
jgi:hypothetical protein